MNQSVERITLEYIKEQLKQLESVDADAANAIRVGIRSFQLYDDWGEQRDCAIRLAEAGKIINRKVKALGERCAVFSAELDRVIEEAGIVADACGKLAEGYDSDLTE